MGNRRLKTAALTQDSQSSVSLTVSWEGAGPSLGMCTECSCTSSVLPGCPRDNAGPCHIEHTQGTDRCAHGEQVSESGGRSAHLGQCKHSPAYTMKCKHYLAKDDWV